VKLGLNTKEMTNTFCEFNNAVVILL